MPDVSKKTDAGDVLSDVQLGIALDAISNRVLLAENAAIERNRVVTSHRALASQLAAERERRECAEELAEMIARVGVEYPFAARALEAHIAALEADLATSEAARERAEEALEEIVAHEEHGDAAQIYGIARQALTQEGDRNG
jgi:uncharacterized protein Yka (UPF0111/DUF47 family)